MHYTHVQTLFLFLVKAEHKKEAERTKTFCRPKKKDFIE